MSTTSLFLDISRVTMTVEVGTYLTPRAMLVDLQSLGAVSWKALMMIEHPSFILAESRRSVRLVTPMIGDLGIEEEDRHRFEVFKILEDRIESLGLLPCPPEVPFQLLLQDKKVGNLKKEGLLYPFMAPIQLPSDGRDFGGGEHLLSMFNGEIGAFGHYPPSIGGHRAGSPIVFKRSDKVIFALPD